VPATQSRAQQPDRMVFAMYPRCDGRGPAA
jgi:hypothetical protein